MNAYTIQLHLQDMCLLSLRIRMSEYLYVYIYISALTGHMQKVNSIQISMFHLTVTLCITQSSMDMISMVCLHSTIRVCEYSV